MLTPGVPSPPAPRCPACASRDAHATDKTVSAATYWRCANCGEIWNPARRDSSASPYFLRHH